MNRPFDALGIAATLAESAQNRRLLIQSLVQSAGRFLASFPQSTGFFHSESDTKTVYTAFCAFVTELDTTRKKLFALNDPLTSVRDRIADAYRALLTESAEGGEVPAEACNLLSAKLREVQGLTDALANFDRNVIGAFLSRAENAADGAHDGAGMSLTALSQVTREFITACESETRKRTDEENRADS